MTSVLFMIPTFDRGGAENVLLDLVNHMDQSKFDITVQTLFDQNSQKHLLREGIKYRSFLYHQFHGNSRLMARIPARMLYRLIVRRRYDVVVSYLEGPTAHIVSGCPYKDSKKISWVHVEMKNARQLAAGFWSFKKAYQAYKSFDKVVFVAKTVRDSFHHILSSELQNETILYNTINTKTIREKASERDAANLYSGDEFNIVSVGRVINAKGFDRLLQVQKKLRESEYNTHVYILGRGNDQESLEKAAKEYELTDSFTFLGFQDNPYPFVANADLFVCSSRREGFSTAVTEALVLGVPVVSTNCSGAYELLGENNEYGIVTDNQEKSLYKGVKTLLDQPEQLEHYRRQAKIRGESFTTDQTVSAVEDMLLGLVKKQLKRSHSE